jgi:superfamily II DNA or RNA helicase
MGADAMNERTTYEDFLRRKLQSGADRGFEPKWMPGFLFPFQAALVEWAIRKGRGAHFADCGLGKTPMQLVWAENVVRQTNRPVLILTPLAVAQQTIREAEKFGIEAVRSSGLIQSGARVVVANYEKLHRFEPATFAGVVCDESSAIKAFDGKRRAEVTEFLRTVPYRLLATATAAPNDYIELGTASEALGEMGQMDMLGRFFKNDQNTSDMGRMHGKVARWRFKGHAEQAFWKWVCSWARACRKPSDLGFDDEGFALPPLVEREHIVETRTAAPGMLFPLPAANMWEEREERRRTIDERCEMAAELVADNGKDPAVVWCHLNAEGDLLAKLIADGRQVRGSMSDEEKEEAYEAFASGQLRVLVIKPKIGAWGLNWQHCAHVVTFASHSYEQYYQAVRRCWRFGQKRRVVVDLVATEGERGVKENLRRKSEAADRMFSELVAHMNEAQRIERGSRYERAVEAPTWL